MKISSFIITALCSIPRTNAGPGTVQFSTSDIPSDVEFESFDFKLRAILPAGPGPLLGYGLGGLEQIAYDSNSNILYGLSEQGYVNIFKFTGDAVEDLSLSIDFGGAKLTDVEVCGDYLFVSQSLGTSPGRVNIYEALKSGEEKVPTQISSTLVGVVPDMIKPNADCTILAVANEGEGDYDGELILPVGSVSLLSNFASATPVVTNIPLDKWTDDELLAKGVHMPLTKNAMEYWDDHSNIADDVDFSSARSQYTPDMNLEPEYVVWSTDGSKVIVNLQENSAAVLIEVTSATEAEVLDIVAYGLKDWSESTIDVFKDDGCEKMKKIPGLYSLRNADSIAIVSVDGRDYILTANEGDDKEYGDFEEKVKSKDIFNGASIEFKNMTANADIFDPTDFTTGTSYMFNKDCDGDDCSTSMRMSVGSSMIDYSNPEAPNIEKMVIFGGRGISIFEVTSDSSLDLVWDSGDDLEIQGCKAFPWAHGGIQDEEFAAVGGTLYNLSDDDLKETIQEMNDPEEDGCEDGGDGNPGACPLGQTIDERSQKDGYAPESIVVGKACGRLYTVTVSEKNSVGYIYEISDITNPVLVKVFHLSPASEKLNPSLAYEQGVIGEIDAESIIFLSEDDSPTGVAGILFAGAFSGSLSWWEFKCKQDNFIEEPDEDDVDFFSLDFLVSFILGLCSL